MRSAVVINVVQSIPQTVRSCGRLLVRPCAICNVRIGTNAEEMCGSCLWMCLEKCECSSSVSKVAMTRRTDYRTAKIWSMKHDTIRC